MTTLESLRKSALDSCNFRGHNMKRFITVGTKGKPAKMSACKRCGKGVFIQTKPYPNEIEIVGEAVALDCVD